MNIITTTLQISYKYLLKYLRMSQLIDIDENQPNPCSNKFNYFSKLFIAAIRNPKFCYLNHNEKGKDIFFSLGGSPHTLYVPSVWKLAMKLLTMSLEVGFVQPNTQMPMRVKMQRLKIQCSAMIRTINLQLYPQYKFVLNPDTGNILFKFQVSWEELEQITKSIEGLQRLIQSVVFNIRKYFDEVTFFTYGSNNHSQYSKKSENPSNQQAMADVNKYRFLMQSAIKQRRRTQYIVKMKQAGDSFKTEAVNLMKIYLNVVEALKLLGFGLEQLQQNHNNPHGLFQKQRNKIKNNNCGLATNNQKKVVYGIINPQKQGNMQLISDEGAHCSIYKQFFHYSIVQTVNFSVNQQWRKNPNYRQNKCAGYLVIKKCKGDRQASINSFLNELKVLQFLKEKKNPFVARYYLQLKPIQRRNQQDSIYMNPYKQNLYNLIKDRKLLTIIQKLIICYRIAKALCFFSMNSMIHRDLKPLNIMIDINLNPKVIDYGSACAVYHSNCFSVHDNRLLITKHFNIRFDQLSEKTKRRYHQTEYEQHKLFDIYSFGKILCYVFFYRLQPPAYQDVSSFGQPLLMQHLLWIIRLCLSEDPDNRPGYGELASFLGRLNQIIEC